MDRPELLETLVCEWEQRPAGAATIADVLPSVWGVHRDGEILVVEFDTSAASTVAAFVDAERRCCSTIRWNLSSQPIVQLRLTGTPNQIEALEQMFSPSDI
jgi:hypothetical protein